MPAASDRGYMEKIAEDPFDELMINHSSNPGVASVMCDYHDAYTYALCDIEEGEEITEDYRIDARIPYLDRLREEYGIDWEFVNK